MGEQVVSERLLHILWTKAVGTKDYDKTQWTELLNQIIRANRPLPAPPEANHAE